MNPRPEHCLAWFTYLLGYVGELDEAKRFMESMPIQPDSSVKGALLGDCRNYANHIWVPIIGPGFLSYGMHKKSSMCL